MKGKRHLRLSAPKITLAPIEEKDKADLLRMLQSEAIGKTYMLPTFSSEEQKESFFLRLKSLSSDEARFVYGIRNNEDDSLVGMLNEVEDDGESIEVGYFIDEKSWGKGYATEALSIAIKELFRLGYKRVKAAHFENNYASARVMAKAGMHLSGERSEVEYKGRVYSCIEYVIDNPDQ